jgi:hypothetical protein
MNPGNEPTEKQIKAIMKLAKRTNTSIDVDGITSKKEASGIIDDLIARLNGNGNADSSIGSADCREKRVVYGLAVKLVFGRYQQVSTNYRTEEFWKEVDEFYRQYLEHQDRATKSGSRG